MTRTISRILMMLLFPTTLACVACSELDEPPTEQAPAHSVSVADEDAGITLSVSIPTNHIRTTDRLDVTIRLIRPAEHTVTLFEPDWESAGLTRIDAIDTPPQIVTGSTESTNPHSIVRQRVVTIEPFLAGAYQIPATTIEWQSGLVSQALSTPPLSFDVVSVLEASDASELAPPEGLAEPAPPIAPNHTPTLIILASLLIAGVAAWRLTRPTPSPPTPPTPAETLARIAAQSNTDPGTMHELHRTLVHARPIALDAEAIDALISRCERARFNPGAPAEQPATIASEALAVLASPPEVRI